MLMKLFNMFATSSLLPIIDSIDYCLVPEIIKCIPNWMDPIKAQELNFTLKNVNDV